MKSEEGKRGERCCEDLREAGQPEEDGDVQRGLRVEASEVQVHEVEERQGEGHRDVRSE